MAEPTENLPLADRMRAMTEQVKGLLETQRQLVATFHEIQDVVTFGDHPDLTALDDELDIMYRGQL